MVRGVLTRYAAWMVALTVLTFALPAWHPVTWTAIGLSSVAAIGYGAVRHRPRRRGPWVLLAAAVLCLTAGDLTADILVQRYGQSDPFPSPADVLYLAMYVLIAVGMVWLYRLGAAGRDISGVLDGLTLTAGVALISWVNLIGPYVQNQALTPVQRGVAIGYPLGDILILAVGASLVGSVRTTPAVRLLAVGGIGLLAADVAYGLIQLHGDWHVGTAVDLGWIVFYAAWGAAAIHPSMRELTEPAVGPRRPERPRRLALLGLASLIAPAVLLVEANTRPGVVDGTVIAILSAILSVLVLTRLGRALRVQRRSLSRERGLRQAGSALLSATDVDGVRQVVAAAVGRLLPRGAGHRVVLAPTEPADADAAAMTMVYTGALPAPVDRELDGFEVALRCPLAVERYDGAGPPGGRRGALYIAADELALIALQEAALVLATQTALALERIVLGAEVDRRNSEAYFRALIDNAADVILIVDDADRIRFASPSAPALFGLDDLSATALPDLVLADHRDDVRQRLGRARRGGADRTGRDWLVGRPDGGVARVEARCRDLRAEPSVAGVVVTLRDVTQSRVLQDALFRKATVDGLTGLPNREVFAGAAQDSIGHAQRHGGVASVLVVELDDFQVVNNTMGYAAGDELLVAIGQRLSLTVPSAAALVAGPPDRHGARPDGLVARLGGDEFAACVLVGGDEQVQPVVTAVLGCFAEPFALAQGVVRLGASVGVAVSTESASAQELLRQADLAVYAAKGAGKGRAMRYEASLHAAVLDRLRLRTELEQAVADGAFSLEFQPIVDLATGRTVSFEALVRWDHPQRGFLGPDAFIELAEETGLIVPLGTWVLRHAIQAAARLAALGPGPGPTPRMSVNVSVRQFRDPDFVDLVRGALSATGLPPYGLVLEITESLLVRAGGVDEALGTLRSDGVRVAIDDFGTGFSSLSYLQQLPVDVLKLDKSFVDTLTSSQEQHAVLTAVTELAQALHLDVVAEGIETSAELAVLTSMGCGYGQGYLLSRPLSYDDAVAWLRDELTSAT